MEKVLFYGGEFCYGFSNFSSFAVEWRGKVWPSSEHAYQAAKFDDQTIINETHAARSAHNAFKLARKYEENIRPSWNDEKINTMEDIIKNKLAQHPYIQKQLKVSGTAELIEAAEKDAFWGRGPDWKGQNNLDKLWMKPRDEL